MLLFLSQMHWYEILFGGLAAIFVVVIGFWGFMIAATHFFVKWVMSEKLQSATFWIGLVLALAYLTHLVTKYT